MSEKEVVVSGEGGLFLESLVPDEVVQEGSMRGRSSYDADQMAGLYDGVAQAQEELHEREPLVDEEGAQRLVSSSHFFTDHSVITDDVGPQGSIAGVDSHIQGFVTQGEAELSVMMLGEKREEEEEQNEKDDAEDIIGAAAKEVVHTVAGYEAVVVEEEVPVPEVFNVAPVAQDDAFAGNEGVSITGNLLDDNGSGADADADGGALSVVAGVFATAGGSITITADGAFTYTPDAGYAGVDSYDYTLEDGQGGSDTATASFTLVDVADINGNDADNFLLGDVGGNIAGDVIDGNGGNDYLAGGDGADLLTGGAGADAFVWWALENHGPDVITDFVPDAGDTLELSDILGAYDPMTDVITDFVLITDDGTDSFLSVDIDGGGDSFSLLAIIEGVTGLTDEAALMVDNIIVV